MGDAADETMDEATDADTVEEEGDGADESGTDAGGGEGAEGGEGGE